MNGGGEHVATESAMPVATEKVVQSVKEIVDCTEHEIYAVLEECDMDVNRAVEKLLSQDTFHEVKNKREKKKEGPFNSRTRGKNAGLSRRGKTGRDCSVVQSGLTHVTYNEHYKANGKGEGESVCVSASVMGPTTHDLVKSIKSDYFSNDNGRQSLITRHSVSDSAQASSGPQPSITGVKKGHLSMADIVRMGRTSSQDVVNNFNTSGVSACRNLESSLGLPCQNHSEQQVFHDEWPVIEHPIARYSQAPNMYASNSDGPLEHPSLHDTALCSHRNSELDVAPVSWRDVACDVVSEETESAPMSTKPALLSSNTGLQSHSNSNFGNTLSPDHRSSHKHHEDVSSSVSILQRLSIGESKPEVPTFEDEPSVVIPIHLQALGADCSHLSFGTYNRGSNSTSAVLTSNHLSKNVMEVKSAAVDDSSAQFLDASSVDYGYKQLGFDVPEGAAGDKNSDFLSSPKQWPVNHVIPQEIVEHEHNITASSRWVNTSLPLEQPGLGSRNHFTFSREQYADPNSIPGDLLSFLTSQSHPARHSNEVSSISNLAISMSNVTEPSAFSLPMRSALPQDPTIQSSTHFHQFLDKNGYLSLRSPQAFSGHTAHEYPADTKYNLVQNGNEFLINRLPPRATVRDAFGYGNLGSLVYSSESFLANPSPSHVIPSSNLNETLSSQYRGGHNLSSFHQHGSSSQWDYGSESGTSFIPERTQSNFLGHPNQAFLLQYASPGYFTLNHSQPRVLEEHQHPGSFQDLSSKNLHQFWQHNN
ncbi:uncharacterized protein LOC106779670 isoform X1 [Vigna radiata var. radiata]|uniref:Uncharacterized protein LOC106779670 isoform X1 n=2 Tax=Vigna radiata var. radiata TaxID=3916 RepID=A0A1S3VYC5_VIGRR|nr:uncharacterized protein LOC106779670 isoform X1 [Vigna radiata var. radiata]